MNRTVNLMMATLPDRVKTLKKAMRSLADQVDTIQVVVNNFSKIDLFQESFMDKPITVIEHDNSMKDGSRFINAHKKDGYCLVCDDDIEYPPDYVQRMIEVYESSPKIDFLAPMGKVLKPRPLKSYYKGWAENYKTFSEVKELTKVDIPGCCGILWHTDRFRVRQEHIKIPNSDVCIGVLAWQHGAQCFVIPHKADWLKNLMPELPSGTLDIYNTYRNNDKVQTDFINKNM